MILASSIYQWNGIIHQTTMLISFIYHWYCYGKFTNDDGIIHLPISFTNDTSIFHLPVIMVSFIEQWYWYHPSPLMLMSFIYQWLLYYLTIYDTIIIICHWSWYHEVSWYKFTVTVADYQLISYFCLGCWYEVNTYLYHS